MSNNWLSCVSRHLQDKYFPFIIEIQKMFPKLFNLLLLCKIFFSKFKLVTFKLQHLYVMSKYFTTDLIYNSKCIYLNSVHISNYFYGSLYLPHVIQWFSTKNPSFSIRGNNRQQVLHPISFWRLNRIHLWKY